MKRMRWFLPAGVVAALLSLALLVAACDGDDGDSGNGDGDATATVPAAGNGAAGAEVDVGIREFEVIPSRETVAAGSVTFKVANEGAVVHTFSVVKSDLDPGELPLNEPLTAVDEAQVDVLASTAGIAPGSSEEVTLDLEPGRYVLMCNIDGHYVAGTFAGFTVE